MHKNLNEARLDLGIKQVTVIKNPTPTRLMGFVDNTRYKEARGVLLADGDTYWWDSYEVVHEEVLRYFGDDTGAKYYLGKRNVYTHGVREGEIYRLDVTKASLQRTLRNQNMLRILSGDKVWFPDARYKDTVLSDFIAALRDPSHKPKGGLIINKAPLVEARMVLSNGEQVTVNKNVGGIAVNQLLMNSTEQELRAVLIRNDFYVWDGYKAYHWEVIDFFAPEIGGLNHTLSHSELVTYYIDYRRVEGMEHDIPVLISAGTGDFHGSLHHPALQRVIRNGRVGFMGPDGKYIRLEPSA